MVQLYNCQTFVISHVEEINVPKTFELKNGMKLIELLKVRIDHWIGYIPSDLQRFFFKIISLAPNLFSVKTICEGNHNEN
jgi:hypothetical protein